MLDEQIDAIRRAADEVAREDGRFRARLAAMYIHTGGVECEYSAPMPRDVGRYLQNHRQLGERFIEKEHDNATGWNFWRLIYPADVAEEPGEMQSVDCRDCDWSCESPFHSRLDEFAAEHEAAEEHTVTERSSA
ncbi:hypothetical protein [Halobacterium wangiae]|uniref:hypothetical protein n=1 Tax=Halobacterium wangiae TaxID=2902623 RepID=UPI001E481D43|nr:hypothetical protein [Halobacterium wangiae]